jgi:hypothetical protein
MCRALGALIAGEASPFEATSVRLRSGGRQLRVAIGTQQRFLHRGSPVQSRQFDRKKRGSATGGGRRPPPHALIEAPEHATMSLPRKTHARPPWRNAGQF